MTDKLRYDNVYMPFDYEDGKLFSQNNCIQISESDINSCYSGDYFTCYPNLDSLFKYEEFSPTKKYYRITPIGEVSVESELLKVSQFQLLEECVRDYNFYLSVVKACGYNIEHVPKEFHTDEMYLDAVMSCSESLYHIEPEHLTKELLFKAIENDPCSLRFIPMEMRTEELCLEAVKRAGYALSYVPSEIRTKEMNLEAVKNYGCALSFIPRCDQTEELRLAAVKSDGYAINHIRVEDRTMEMMHEAVEKCGTEIKILFLTTAERVNMGRI